jgi:hypothetical protein
VNIGGYAQLQLLIIDIERPVMSSIRKVNKSEIPQTIPTKEIKEVPLGKPPPQG